MADNARTLQHLTDPQAERAVIAAALLDADGAEGVIPRLSLLLGAGDFYDPRHATLWEVLLALHGRGEPIDVLTVVAELRLRDRLHTIGGPQYIGELTDEIPTLAHCESHARIVNDLAQRRRALEACQLATRRLHAGDPLPTVRVELERVLVSSNDRGGALSVGRDLDPLLDAMWARREGREGPIGTPWSSVNNVLGGGMWPGMYVLVGGTGTGKTQWAVQAAVEAARTGASVLYLALELSRIEVAARIVGAITRVPWSGILRGSVSDEDVQRVLDARRYIETIPFFTECGVPYGYGVETLAGRATALRPQLIVLDYLQLCNGRHGEEARASVGRVSYTARAMAQELGAAVLVISSTARANYAELVNDPARDPSDLVGLGKESGEIEYAADGVLVLARHADRPRGRVLVIAKNRHGPLGRADLDWTGTAFVESDAPEEIVL